jgi:hypothetical protein
MRWWTGEYTGESNYPGGVRAWLVDRVFVLRDWLPSWVQQWAMNHDHF